MFVFPSTISTNWCRDMNSSSELLHTLFSHLAKFGRIQHLVKPGTKTFQKLKTAIGLKNPPQDLTKYPASVSSATATSSSSSSLPCWYPAFFAARHECELDCSVETLQPLGTTCCDTRITLHHPGICSSIHACNWGSETPANDNKEEILSC